MTNARATKPIEILLVEDNPADVRLTKEALREGKVRNRLHVAEDGVVAMSFLRREGDFTDVPRPDLVLLDLNMPRKGGREVLAEMKGDPQLLRIPVVVLTTSSDERDILESYGLHANSYVTKPVGLEAFIEVVRSIEDYWLEIVKLPRDGQP
jgi:CheY-like chemotaxis protein